MSFSNYIFCVIFLYLNSNSHQALYSFDSERSSFIALEDFRKVVENFIFPLTSAQFDQLVKKLDGVSNQKLNYNQLLFKIKKTKSRDTPILGRVTPANDSLDSIVSKLQQKVRRNPFSYEN